MAKKRIAYMTSIFIVKFGYNWIKTVGAVAFEKLGIGNFAKFTEWPRTELNESDMKQLKVCSSRDCESQIFIRSTTSPFQDIVHFRVSPLTPSDNGCLRHDSIVSWAKNRRLLANYGSPISARICFFQTQVTWQFINIFETVSLSLQVVTTFKVQIITSLFQMVQTVTIPDKS